MAAAACLMGFLSSCNVGMRWGNTRPLINPHTKCPSAWGPENMLPTLRGLCIQSTAQGSVNLGTCELLRHSDMVTDTAPILDYFQWMSWWLQSFHWMLMDVLVRSLLPMIQCDWTCLPMCGLLWVGPSWWNLRLNCARMATYEDPCSRHVTIATFSCAVNNMQIQSVNNETRVYLLKWNQCILSGNKLHLKHVKCISKDLPYTSSS